MSWEGVDTYPHIPMGGNFVIDRRRAPILTIAPDARITWVSMADDSPFSATADDPPDYEDDNYPFYSIRGLSFENPRPIAQEIPSFGGLAIVSMYTILMPTQYPKIDTTNGFMQDNKWKTSWVRAVYTINFGGVTQIISSATKTNGYFGQWSQIEDYYTNVAISYPHTSFWISMATSAYNATSISDGNYVEVINSHKMQQTSPEQLDQRIINPVNGETMDLYNLSSLSDQQRFQQHYPWLDPDTAAAGNSVTTRDFRYDFAEISHKFVQYPAVYADMYARFFHTNYNSNRSAQYLSGRFQNMAKMLSYMTSLPKEYAVRRQPSKKINVSKLSYLPTESMEIESMDSSATTTSGPAATSTGGGYGGSY
jgi:hypothetical protein